MDSFFFQGGFSLVFAAAFTAVAALVVVTAVRGIVQTHRNNRSPRLTVPATVTAKRTQVTHRRRAGAADGSMGMDITTRDYATFEVESGDRMELAVPAGDFALLAEGDKGRLSFQGTRFLGFERG